MTNEIETAKLEIQRRLAERRAAREQAAKDRTKGRRMGYGDMNGR